jgi:hypothetical protein
MRQRSRASMRVEKQEKRELIAQRTKNESNKENNSRARGSCGRSCPWLPWPSWPFVLANTTSRRRCDARAQASRILVAVDSLRRAVVTLPSHTHTHIHTMCVCHTLASLVVVDGVAFLASRENTSPLARTVCVSARFSLVLFFFFSFFSFAFGMYSDLQVDSMGFSCFASLPLLLMFCFVC